MYGPQRRPDPMKTAGREDRGIAAARCACYGLFSDLTASPHEVDSRAAVADRRDCAAGLPYEGDFAALARDYADRDIEALRTQYSGLFEVGSQGPPAPIREDLLTGQKGGTREEIVRFYDYFGYRLDDRHAWAPDHLSVELEFMHYLCFHEAQADADQLSWQLAQADFTARHLVRWVPQLHAAVAQLEPACVYARVLAALEEFLSRDLAWQNATIRPCA